MKPTSRTAALAVLVAALAGAGLALNVHSQPAKDKAAAPRAALSVTVTQPQPAQWAQTLSANGNVAAWQETIVGAELGGVALAQVLVNVGDVVKRGQPLARLVDDTIRADVAQAQAALAEAQAALAEAKANAERARALQQSGALSAQQISQYLTGEQTAAARVQAARAQLDAQQLRLRKTQVLAPDDGVVSARSAAVGSVAQPGLELFRLIRQGRLEWRAEVPATELPKVKPGQAVTLLTPAGTRVAGKVRQLAPTIDPQTRNALVYVDLQPGPGSDVRAGLFARGEFTLAQRPVLTLPAAAVLLREGFSYVMVVGPDSKVSQVKVEAGQRQGDRIEVRNLKPEARVVDRGAAFLADGDTVQVVDAPPAAAAGASRQAAAGAAAQTLDAKAAR
ncbi:efflux RND transporter periplasmic adaptor subunit [Azohydromonas caseinilytica]|uniref:Efflux RND transporter periplasmic adaptor subunit n=1 Tax=Azohydromonas caseinilytica TaxID=2728836 RepID=A0A848F7K7_9BURK|nr:efflux RND transporter periplasmic adaptor subunit [Azohydromonas caseinilytica]NML15148.1 efflux RND transporter periplasmic adaptor subunit [Azohydromonas caseinilytica]